MVRLQVTWFLSLLGKESRPGEQILDTVHNMQLHNDLLPLMQQSYAESSVLFPWIVQSL